ncbi:undecaprenyl-phosphate glucose phosphotransferase, partial [Klebsiella pneumoniae]
MPVGVSLAKSFNDEPWLGFVVVGLYDINPPNANLSDIEYKGDFEQLIADAKKGKLDRIYLE